LAGLLAIGSTARAADQKTDFKFYFGTGATPAGYTQVKPTDVYSKDAGFGFEPGAKVTTVDRGGADPMAAGLTTSDAPFYFSFAEPEGNYKVTVTLGDAKAATTTTVKAELRRLMLEHIQTDPGQFATRTFIVNVRVPQISTGGVVKLKSPRETTQESRGWDDKLTLEFNDKHPGLVAIEVAKVDLPTLFILGDSTVCDQSAEPFCSWGQMMPRFFKPDIAVSNQAESGETIASSTGAKRLDKVLSMMKPGDWLLFQFGHNDMKNGNPDGYRASIERWVGQVKAKGGQAIVVTPMNRHTFQGNVVTNSLLTFPDMARTAAKDTGAPLVDLNAMSKVMYEALGPDGSLQIFEHNADFSQKDATHHSPYGAYELAKCVLSGIQADKLDLASHISDDFKGFDPAKPDPVAGFDVPPSPNYTNNRPLGD
jgi:lysophospholipase L1-like esterase